MRQLELDTDREIEELKEDKVRMGWDSKSFRSCLTMVFIGFQAKTGSQGFSMDFNGDLNWTSSLRSAEETKLKAERDDKVRLRGQAGIHKRNGEELTKQMIQKEDELQRYKEEVASSFILALNCDRRGRRMRGSRS